jgi:hypothetical protein
MTHYELGFKVASCYIALIFIISMLCDKEWRSIKRGAYLNLEFLTKYCTQLAFTNKLLKDDLISEREKNVIISFINKKYNSSKLLDKEKNM